ncbi:AP endonuclease 2 protein [Dioscorea alata]|uniref:AP endonuclease 2 protein n=1 Tax=Dioscorea alata TaxID=55571 RepID=A0ACB7V6D8_DIOAL|nr:AP endonuclease 2 protein [Dioscorea alata]
MAVANIPNPQAMKIVTYNVNGLRQRVSQHGSLRSLLNSLDADIICFQETKLSRQDLSVDLTMAEGYEGFVSCTRTSTKGRSGYSGVATFCRVNSVFSSDEVALPLDAEEGFTGLLEQSVDGKTIMRDVLLDMPMVVEGEEVTKEELLKVDSEGRCLITDHGHFVIFNLYGPRAVDDDNERLRFKLIFFMMLQKRWEFLLSQGKRIIVLGDLNIAPAAIDRCDAEPGFERNKFRKWLRSLLRESGGPFFDVFRGKHPNRTEAYTCFSARIGAEEFNYGSRIDHILVAGSCLHPADDSDGHNFFGCHVEECDIMSQFKRGNRENTSKWKGGRATKLEGSDHIPVYAILTDVPNLHVHNTPSLAVRYIPEVRGWQPTIVTFLTKREDFSITKYLGTSESVATINAVECGVTGLNVGATSRQHGYGPGFIGDETEKNLSKLKTEEVNSHSHCSPTVKKKARHNTCSQLTLRSFFQQSNSIASHRGCADTKTSPSSPGLLDAGMNKDNSSQTTEVVDRCPTGNAEDGACEVSESGIDMLVENQSDISGNLSFEKEKANIAALEWQRIQQKMKMSIPLCKGHKEPCVARCVKKEGPNIGRRFYVCARATGPASNPEANCGYFEWASVKSKRKER